MTLSAAILFVVIVLAASLRAFAPRRAADGKGERRGRRGAGLVLGQPVPTLDLVGGERRSSPLRLGAPRRAGPAGRFGD